MMLHAPLMGAALFAAILAAVLAALGYSAVAPALAAAVLFGGLAAERLVAGLSATLRLRDAGGLLFWNRYILCAMSPGVAAIAVWGMRRLRSARPDPSDSMRPRQAHPRPRVGETGCGRLRPCAAAIGD